MKYAKKMMVIPFVKKLENPSEKFLENLDTEMTTILHTNNISVDEKIKLYNATLNRFKLNYDPSTIGTHNNFNESISKVLEKKQTLPELAELTELLKRNIIKNTANNKTNQEEYVKNYKNNDISMLTDDENLNETSSPISSLTKKFNDIPTNPRESISNFTNPFNKSKKKFSPILLSDAPRTSILDDTQDFGFDSINTPKYNIKNINTRRSKKKLSEPLSYKYRQDNLETLNNVVDLDKKIIPKCESNTNYFR